MEREEAHEQRREEDRWDSEKKKAIFLWRRWIGGHVLRGVVVGYDRKKVGGILARTSKGRDVETDRVVARCRFLTESVR